MIIGTLKAPEEWMDGSMNTTNERSLGMLQWSDLIVPG